MAIVAHLRLFDEAGCKDGEGRKAGGAKVKAMKPPSFATHAAVDALNMCGRHVRCTCWLNAKVNDIRGWAKSCSFKALAA